jgi:hypothetical protein
MWLLRDFDFVAIRRKHPDRNFQSPAGRVDDRDRSVSPLRPPEDLKSSAAERVERVEDPYICTLHAQGIVGVGVSTRMSIV